MECPYCGGSSKVIESRKIEMNVFRVRSCSVCKKRFYTEETSISLEEARPYVAAVKRQQRERQKQKELAKAFVS